MVPLVEQESKSKVGKEGLQHVGVIIPTFNAARHWPSLEASLSAQGLKPHQILIIDSSSKDGTLKLARRSGYKVVRIPQEEFGHGRTRQLACSYLPHAEMLLLLTQDVVLDTPRSVRNLCSALADPAVGAAFGRQLPRPQANAIERHARLFNYTPVSQVRTFESRHTMGIKAAFASNSFALYRRCALEDVGGFPSDVISLEDTYVAAKLLMAGWKVAYCAEATAIHSHHFTVREEFSRYFSIGVHHARESWMLEAFGTADSEGLKFVKSELRYLLRSAKRLIPVALLRTASKLIAYRLGKAEHSLPLSVNRFLSGNDTFWHDREESLPITQRVRTKEHEG